jgi:hypothetical protein
VCDIFKELQLIAAKDKFVIRILDMIQNMILINMLDNLGGGVCVGGGILTFFMAPYGAGVVSVTSISVLLLVSVLLFEFFLGDLVSGHAIENPSGTLLA